MAKRVTVILDDDAADLLLELAGSSRKQGKYLSTLVRAAAASRRAPGGVDLAALHLQVLGLTNELHTVKARLVTLEGRDE
ncbi:MAG TPA: hypothetical protein VKY74_18115 [Chloroflexia bacterium]|nr:hypothetical protein [Chloroflexia bacterium]